MVVLVVNDAPFVDPCILCLCWDKLDLFENVLSHSSHLGLFTFSLFATVEGSVLAVEGSVLAVEGSVVAVEGSVVARMVL